MTPDWLSAIASWLSVAGIFLAFWQLQASKQIAQLAFEDSLAKEYRDLCCQIPSQVFLKKSLPETEFTATFEYFYRYIDLSNEQILLRQRGRVSEKIWADWRSGIKENLALPDFAKAWGEIKQKSTIFKELRKLEDENFTSDPKKWP